MKARPISAAVSILLFGIGMLLSACTASVTDPNAASELDSVPPSGVDSTVDTGSGSDADTDAMKELSE